MVSCSCKKTSISNFEKATLKSDCPKDGTCSVEIIKNKSISIKKDEFGSIYYLLEDNLNTTVVKYSYSRTVKGDLQDAGYREEIVFEIDENNKTLKNRELTKTNMLFGRFCFCRGQTGNYIVDNGELEIKDNTINLNFTVSQVPQIIKNIVIKL